MCSRKHFADRWRATRYLLLLPVLALVGCGGGPTQTSDCADWLQVRSPAAYDACLTAKHYAAVPDHHGAAPPDTEQRRDDSVSAAGGHHGE